MANVSVITADVIAALAAPTSFPTTAGEVITSIRYQIPDPTFNPVTGVQDNPYNPDHDGYLIPAAILYRWLFDGMRELCRRSHWFVNDWYAFPAIANQPTYELDPRWQQIEAAWAYQLRCYPLPEQYTIYPSQAVAQPIQYGQHRRVGVMDVYYYPTPDNADPVTTLTADMTSTATTIAVADTTNFQPFGWALIEGELLQYWQLTPTSLGVCRRGLAGTRANVHLTGMNVTSCALWIKGYRTPTQVTASGDYMEVPEAFLAPLETYVLEKVARGPEKDIAAANALKQKFDEEVRSIVNDPIFQGDLRDGTAQVSAYGGYGRGGPIYWYDGIDGVIVP